jgi:PAS domain-containing protein
VSDPEGSPRDRRDSLAVAPLDAEQELADLRRRAAVLDALLNSLPPFIMTLDLDYRVLTVNRTIPEVPREAVIGASAFAFIAPPFHEAARRCFEEVLRTAGPSKLRHHRARAGRQAGLVHELRGEAPGRAPLRAP